MSGKPPKKGIEYELRVAAYFKYFPFMVSTGRVFDLREGNFRVTPARYTELLYYSECQVDFDIEVDLDDKRFCIECKDVKDVKELKKEIFAFFAKLYNFHKYVQLNKQFKFTFIFVASETLPQIVSSLVNDKGVIISKENASALLKSSQRFLRKHSTAAKINQSTFEDIIRTTYFVDKLSPQKIEESFKISRKSLPLAMGKFAKKLAARTKEIRFQIPYWSSAESDIERIIRKYHFSIIDLEILLEFSPVKSECSYEDLKGIYSEILEQKAKKGVLTRLSQRFYIPSTRYAKISDLLQREIEQMKDYDIYRVSPAISMMIMEFMEHLKEHHVLNVYEKSHSQTLERAFSRKFLNKTILLFPDIKWVLAVNNDRCRSLIREAVEGESKIKIKRIKEEIKVNFNIGTEMIRRIIAKYGAIKGISFGRGVIIENDLFLP